MTNTTVNSKQSETRNKPILRHDLVKPSIKFHIQIKKTSTKSIPITQQSTTY